MGIDILDLSFRIEKEFGVPQGSIGWSELLIAREGSKRPDIRVGDLHRSLNEHLAGRRTPRSYESLRVALHEQLLQVNPDLVAQDASLCDFNRDPSRDQRIRFWQSLAQALPIPPPALEVNGALFRRSESLAPEAIDTFAQLVDRVWSDMQCTSKQEVESTTLWERLRTVIADTLSVDEQEITPDSLLFADLGAE